MDDKFKETAKRLSAALEDVFDEMPEDMRRKISKDLLKAAPLEMKMDYLKREMDSLINKLFPGDGTAINVGLMIKLEDENSTSDMMAGTGDELEQKALIEYFSAKLDDKIAEGMAKHGKH